MRAKAPGDWGHFTDAPNPLYLGFHVSLGDRLRLLETISVRDGEALLLICFSFLTLSKRVSLTFAVVERNSLSEPTHFV